MEPFQHLGFLREEIILRLQFYKDNQQIHRVSLKPVICGINTVTRVGIMGEHEPV